MVAFRAFAIVLAATISFMAMQAQASIFPYEVVTTTYPNGVLDSAAGACNTTDGCYDLYGRNCADNPADICNMAIVPEGRCSRGSSGAVWPGGAGFCVDKPAVACLPDDVSTHSVVGNSTIGDPDGPKFSVGCSGIPGFGLCDYSTNVPANFCQDDTPNDADGTFTICGGSAPVCSDGDPHRIAGGWGTGLCIQLNLTGDTRTNCGDNSDSSDTTGATYPLENPAENVTLQRTPGTTSDGPILDSRTTQAYEFDTIDAFGVRRFKTLGDSYFTDYTFNNKLVTGGDLSSHIVVHSFPGFFGWATERSLSGDCDLTGAFCTLGSDCPTQGTCSIAGTLCTDIDDCPGVETCDNIVQAQVCQNELFGHEVAPDGQGFILDPATFDPVAAAAESTCPPNCGLDYNHSVPELEAIEGVGADDPEAAIQLSLDNVTGGVAGAGDVLSVTASTSLTWIGDSQFRCFLGGDPDPVATPAQIGRCVSTLEFCDPTVTGPTECTGGGACEYCGGRFVPVTNPLALPIGYDAHGLPELSLTAPGGDPTKPRIAGLNGAGVAVVVPLFVIGTTGVVSSSFRDNPDLGGADLANLGPEDGLTGFAPGIAAGGTILNGTNLPIGMGATCCDTGADITYAALSEGVFDPFAPGGTVTSDFLRLPDRGPGPDGIPGCFGDNDPASNGINACDGIDSDIPGGPVNTGGDDIRLTLVTDEPGLPFHAARAKYGATGGSHPDVETRFPGANLPTWASTGASSIRDLDVIGANNTDVNFKVTNAACPIVGGVPVCCRDDDGDGACHDVDPCRDFANTPGFTPGTIPGECLCGDANANGVHEFSDAFVIIGCANLTGDPVFCAANAGRLDANGNGVAEFSDAFAVIGQANLTATVPSYQLTCLDRPSGLPPIGFAP